MSEDPPENIPPENEEPASPAPGWYPDPFGAAQQRWWDGATWTSQIHPAAPADAWGAPPQNQPHPPTGDAGYPPQPGANQYGYYAPPTPLADSGMRRVPALFADVGRIIARAWLPIVGVSLVIWLVWSALVFAASSLVINYGNLLHAIDLSTKSLDEYSNGRVPSSVQLELNDAWYDVIRFSSPWFFVALAVIFILLTIYASALQTTAVNRLGIDASSGQPAQFGSALRAGIPAAFRLFGYLILLTAIIVAVSLVLVFLVVAASQLGDVATAIASIVSAFGFIALVVGIVLLYGRLVPILVQVDMGPGALAWSWQATKGKSWAVLGRYLLWSLVAYFVIEIVLSILMVPVYSAMVISAASQNGAVLMVSGFGFLFLIWPISLAVSSLSLVGVVPIWRDLTDDPTYRSIDPDGIPVSAPS